MERLFVISGKWAEPPRFSVSLRDGPDDRWVGFVSAITRDPDVAYLFLKGITEAMVAEPENIRFGTG